MMLKKRLSKGARDHIAEIRRFTLQNWGKEQAASYVKEIQLRVDLLAEMPHIGVDRSLELGDGIHCCLLGSHAIYYSFDAAELTVWAVLHQSRIPGRHLSRMPD